MRLRAVFARVLQKEDWCCHALTFMIQPGPPSAKTRTLMDQAFAELHLGTSQQNNGDRMGHRKRESGPNLEPKEKV